MRSVHLVLVCTLGAAACAPGLTLPEGTYGANWAGPPGADHYPSEASSRNIPGLVFMTCLLNESRGLDDCEVVYESAPGWGFGAASLRAAENISIRTGPTPGTRVLQAMTYCNDDRNCSQVYALRDEIKAMLDRRRAEAGLLAAATSPDSSSPSPSPDVP